MRLSDEEIRSFLRNRLNLGIELPSRSYLGKLMTAYIRFNLWQNVDLILNDVDCPPSWKTIKSRVFSGRGGTCIVLNQFFKVLLTSLGFQAYHALSRRNDGNATHVIILVKLEDAIYFVDVGDAQPFFEPICLFSSTVDLRERFLDYQVSQDGELYTLVVKSFRGIETRYTFSTSEVPSHILEENANLHCSKVHYGSLWDHVHLVSFRNEKLFALKGAELLFEEPRMQLNQIELPDLVGFTRAYGRHFSQLPIGENEFLLATKEIRRIRSLKLFGVVWSDIERDDFIQKLGLSVPKLNLSFLKEFILAVQSLIPFSNIQMHKRGFGYIPLPQEMKSDVVTFKGGTCFTMNSVLGSFLYSLGFDTYLIHGTMSNPNDHVAIGLRLNKQVFVIDLGDGQPYFEPFPIAVYSEYIHPFRTYRTVPFAHNLLRIDFYLNKQWRMDVVYNLQPIEFQDALRTASLHYTNLNYGPFWTSIRFVLYPNQRILGVRGSEFIQEDKSSTIRRSSFSTAGELSVLLSDLLPDHKNEILQLVEELK